MNFERPGDPQDRPPERLAEEKLEEARTSFSDNLTELFAQEANAVQPMWVFHGGEMAEMRMIYIAATDLRERQLLVRLQSVSVKKELREQAVFINWMTEGQHEGGVKIYLPAEEFDGSPGVVRMRHTLDVQSALDGGALSMQGGQLNQAEYAALKNLARDMDKPQEVNDFKWIFDILQDPENFPQETIDVVQYLRRMQEW